MAHRLTERQAKVIAIIEAELAAKKTPQIAFFWRKLRAAALPKIPPPKRGATVAQNALVQVRWQRMAALAGDSHVAAQALLKQEIELLREIEAGNQPEMATLAPEQAREQLIQLVESAPRATKYAIYRQLSEIPGFRAAVEGDDEEEEGEAPGALVVHDGGRAR